LTNGQSYTFAVRAVNAYGDAESTKDGTPGAPTGLTASAVMHQAGQVKLCWDHLGPASMIERYQINVSGPGTSLSNNVQDPASLKVEGLARDCYTVGGLNEGDSYGFRVRAIYSAGSVFTEISAAPGTPVAPKDLTAAAGAGEVTLSWDDPDNAAITRYQYSTDGGTDWSDIDPSDHNTTSYTVTGLEAGTSYTFYVRAVSDHDDGAASSVDATPVATPLAPAGLKAAAVAG